MAFIWWPQTYESAEGEPVSREFDGFALQLVSELETAFWPSSGGHKRMKVQREKMWGQYHLIRSSAVFRERWFGILQLLHGCHPCPVFYQYVTDNVCN